MESTTKKEIFYRDLLISEFEKIKERNSKMSIRAFARYLGVQAPTLSHVLNGKRNLPASDAIRISQKLKFDKGIEERFLNSVSESSKVSRTPSSLIKFKKFIDEKLFPQIISDGDHYTVLNVLKLKRFLATKENIGLKCGIDLPKLDKVLLNLMDAELIKIDPLGIYRAIERTTKTTDNLSSEAIREAHRDSLKFASETLGRVPVEKRDFVSLKFPADPNLLDEARKETRKYIKNIHKIMSKGDKTEVYECAVQIFPRTY
jgi:uncharacterized protein (TIGR02147 family)